ncbi:WhiB family transcriptional regulator [Auritidibacter ignavus]|uniref:WhiB family transcriptional regulator n=1 Tax=Auritidibacter ignavus TaxID=678932 RepID=UPI003CC5729A
MNGSWYDRANCRGMDTEVFFDQQAPGYPLVALRVCATCPVSEACLMAALEEESQKGATVRDRVFGIRGGLTPEARAGLKIRSGNWSVRSTS